MTIYVGIYHQIEKSTLYVSTFNTVTQETNVFTIKQLTEDEQINFASIFEDLRASTEDEFGCICIYLGENYDNEFRKEIVEFGEAFGFEKVEILNFYGNQYLQAVYNANYHHQENESIWVAELDGTYIWEKLNGKAKIVQWLPWGPSTKTEFNKFQAAVDVHGKHPKVMFCHPEIVVDFNLMEKFLPNTEVITSARFPNLNIPLIKARIMAADREVLYFDNHNALNSFVVIRYADKNIIAFNEFHTLPCTKSVKIAKKDNEDFFQVLSNPHSPDEISGDTLERTLLRRGNITEVFPLPKYHRFSLTVNFDINEIYHFTFEELPSCSSDAVTELTYFELLTKADNELPATTYSKKYEFLSKPVLTDDIFINAVGIDFGTTYCRAAVNRRNGIEIMALDNSGQKKLASYVSFDEEKAKCGKIVIDRLRYHGKSSVYDLKELVGQNYGNIVTDKRWQFHIIPVEDNNFRVEFQKHDKTYSKYLEEVISVIFKNIKDKAKDFKSRELTGAVISFPYEFNKRQRSGIYVSAQLAGWQSVHLLPEPIAAVLGYSLKTPLLNYNTVLVVDFGGGSFKISILKVLNEEIVTMNYRSTTSVCGKIFDQVLADYFDEKLKVKFGIEVDESQRHQLLMKSQEIKETLSHMEDTWLDVEDFDNSSEEQIFITRTQFEELISSLLSEIKTFIEGVLIQTKTAIDKVLYVGGGCRMPMIKNLLKAIFPTSEHYCDTHPDEINALGAAYYAYYLNLSTRQISGLGLLNDAVFDIMRVVLKEPTLIPTILKKC